MGEMTENLGEGEGIRKKGEGSRLEFRRWVELDFYLKSTFPSLAFLKPSPWWREVDMSTRLEKKRRKEEKTGGV